jgi:mono/diheme cytochrome c family protein/nitrate reductase cytochrome c-type subunit
MRKISFLNVYRLFLFIFILLITACEGSSDDSGGANTGGGNGGGTGNDGPPLSGPASCLSNSSAYVDANYENKYAWDGGALYDKWWVNGNLGATEPATTHPLFATQSKNTRAGSDTWRCKECHGWDYKGVDGAYGDTQNSHYTGFVGIDGAATRSPVEVFCAIREGTNIDSRHAFNSSTTNNTLTDDAILELTRFILDADEKGQIDMDEYINPATGAASGSATIGQAVFNVKAGCGSVSCHGPSGTLNAGHEPGSSIGLLAVENPWEVLHKIRNGHPGSNMPAFVSDFYTNQLTKADMQNVLAYAQTLPGSDTGDPAPAPTDCLNDPATASLVNNIDLVESWIGGRLYDAWWTEANVGAPTNSHSLWATQTTNTRSGADTWRCKECHGWDYKGVDGAYGDTQNSHYTGFPGIMNAVSRTPLQVFCAIRDGEGINSSHRFNAVNTNNGLTDLRILQLTRFILDANQQGIVDSDIYINPATGAALGNAASGQTVYDTTAGCAASNCHGADGLLNAHGTTLGQLSNDNPWEVLHKIRNGHPGSLMPSFVRTLTQTQIQNVLAYTQTLPGTSTGTGSCSTDMASFVNSSIGITTPWNGGQLYDNWAVTTGRAAPITNHPLWSTQSTNTRSGADTWRCKECHGWDYKGASGAYGSGSDHYTGFPGILGSRNKSPVDLFCAIRDGEGINAAHQFNNSNTNGALGDGQILALVNFMTAPGENGMTDSGLFVDPNTNLSLGDATLGQAVYETKANCAACHGADGTERFGGITLGDMATGNPWEVIHKIRYGHPASIMPSYINDGLGNSQLTDNDVKNVLAYAQTLPLTPGTDGGIDPANCLTDMADFVSTNYAAESEVQGGALYDKWWAALGFSAGPVTNHPLWSQQTNNTRTGPDTWRCKECHGWDYKGVDGAYGDTQNSHYTGFPGVMGAQSKQPLEVFCAIYNGTTTYPEHKFNPANSDLTDQAILQLTKFITSASATRGLIDTDLYIDPDTADTIGGDVNQGQLDFGSNCVSCHGANGTLNADGGTLGQLAVGNPWEVLHKIRFGHPGSVPQMPAFIDAPMPIDTMVDIITYVKTLPTTGGVPTPPPVTDTDLVVLGGLLYDNWTATKDVNPPGGDNPLWALQDTNNRTGADTWRCKECHGWDYKGKDGQYGPGSSHYTGFGGVLTIAQDPAQTEQDVINLITNGFVMPGSGDVLHDYGSLFTADEIVALAKFIKEGVVNTDLYIFPSLGIAKGDADRGLDQYTFTGQFIPKGNCSLCHGDNGQEINFGTRAVPEYLGDLARDNPWEVLHKARFGQPGSIMPSMMQNGLAIEHSVDVLTYTQTLPEAPPPRNNDND